MYACDNAKQLKGVQIPREWMTAQGGAHNATLCKGSLRPYLDTAIPSLRLSELQSGRLGRDGSGQVYIMLLWAPTLPAATPDSRLQWSFGCKKMFRLCPRGYLVMRIMGSTQTGGHQSCREGTGTGGCEVFGVGRSGWFSADWVSIVTFVRCIADAVNKIPIANLYLLFLLKSLSNH